MMEKNYEKAYNEAKEMQDESVEAALTASVITASAAVIGCFIKDVTKRNRFIATVAEFCGGITIGAVIIALATRVTRAADTTPYVAQPQHPTALHAAVAQADSEAEPAEEAKC